ncbi:hypothetical protein H0H92_003118 [Tricholoma furcatifolium]|nr:hypothetical protein H0H92_003118 [Tricholoma furcatifolium]
MFADLEERRLDERLGQFHVPISPVKAPSEWLCANVDNIHSIWEEALSLPKDELMGLKKLIYPSTTGGLSSVRGSSLNKLLKLDALSIATRVLAMVNDDQRKKAFLDQRDSHAQTLLDLLQHILDLPELDIVRPSILRVLLELSKRSRLYPTALILRGVEPRGKEPVTSGSYGDIWEGVLAGNIVAIKVMRIDSSFINRGIKRQLFGGSYITRMSYLFKAYINGRIVDVAQGLDYLHNFDPSVIHGDLRATNILITPDKRACIADFGLCTLARDSLLQFTPTSSAYQCTNLLWLAPEFFQFEESGSETPRQSLATDVYSYACVCYEVGLPRFAEMRAPYEVVIAVAQDRRPSRPVHPHLSDSLWELMNRCWSKTPALRPTANQLVHSLSTVTKLRPRSPEKTFSLPPSVLSRSMLFQDIIIALVGPTGSGKSNFINVATETSSVTVGDDLTSCTQHVETVNYPHPDGSGRNIIFVDTPGFDDTEKTDFQVLEQIANWMKETYQDQVTLTGLLFFHRITDVRMRGTPLRNLTMFEALCGKDALRNVVLTTTLWDEVDSVIGEARETQLHSDFWSPLMGEGCRAARFSNTCQSAWDIISLFDINTPRALLVQKEMVDENKDLKATSAFKVLVHWWEQVVTKVKSKFRRRSTQKQRQESEYR